MLRHVFSFVAGKFLQFCAILLLLNASGTSALGSEGSTEGAAGDGGATPIERDNEIILGRYLTACDATGLQFFLEGPGVHYVDRDRALTTAMFACTSPSDLHGPSRAVPLLNLLIAAGADSEKLNTRTMLVLVAHKRDMATINYLLDHDDTLGVPDALVDTMIQAEKVDVRPQVALFISKCKPPTCDVGTNTSNPYNSYGYNALHVLAATRSAQNMDDLLKMLLNAGFDVNSKTSPNGRTPLAIALISRNEAFRKKGARDNF